MKYKKINNLTGWLVGGISLLVYWLTMEETASYWDCGEFIAVSHKLEVPHPPGAPFFLLLGRLFSFLALGDGSQVAYWINMLSVIGSSFTILFLFWSITLFGRKMLGIKEHEVSENQTLLLMGAGVVGALSYTFSDSFWFSAVEAEVYAMSSFFTAFVVWGILKWEATEDESAANRWLILLSYVMGLSIGVHLLNLLTLPALGLIYYFKKFKVSLWGIIAALAISGGLILFINNFTVIGLPSIAGKFEIFFVNTLGMFFGSGALFFLLLIIGTLTYGIYYTQKNNSPIWNTFLLSTTFLLIGYSSYSIIIIRSNFDTPINQNAPKDVMSFIRYLEREQYGSRPILYGPYFTARPVDYEDGAPIYTKGKDKYEITDRRIEYVYESNSKTILPRMWSSEHKSYYERISNLRPNEKPSFTDNIGYMIQHQMGTMYGRYFMWNFAGREHDIQGADWMGPSDWFKDVPDEIADNAGRNNYFMIPLLLGLLGMFFQYNKDPKNFAVIALLFVMLGIAIVVYLNSPPVEPRERDYIYAGSFYAFAFWIGLSIIGLAQALGSVIRNGRVAIIASILLGATAPTIMAAQGWDDHDRSNRFFSVDTAANYLNSCEKGSVLFTGGDNDTFPLWYSQEVEGIRTDMRVIVFSYFNTDWYIEQTKLQAYESAPIDYTLTKENYQQGGSNDVVYYVDFKIPSIDLKQYLQLLKQENPQLLDNGRSLLPSKVLTLEIDKDEVLSKGIIPAGMDSLVVDRMEFHLNKGKTYLEKKDLAFLDMVATANWDRPLYVNNNSMSQLNIDVSPYAVQEGNAFRILPVKSNQQDGTLINLERSYDLVMNTFRFRGLNDSTVYYNEDYRGFIVNHRSALNDLALALIENDQMEKADSILQLSLTKMPDSSVSYDITTPTTVDLLFQVGQDEQALKISEIVGKRAIIMSQYLAETETYISTEIRQKLYILSSLNRTLYTNGIDSLATEYEEAYDQVVNILRINERQ